MAKQRAISFLLYQMQAKLVAKLTIGLKCDKIQRLKDDLLTGNLPARLLLPSQV